MVAATQGDARTFTFLTKRGAVEDGHALASRARAREQRFAGAHGVCLRVTTALRMPRWPKATKAGRSRNKQGDRSQSGLSQAL